MQYNVYESRPLRTYEQQREASWIRAQSLVAMSIDVTWWAAANTRSTAGLIAEGHSEADIDGFSRAQPVRPAVSP